MAKKKTPRLAVTAANGLGALAGEELCDLGIPCEVESGRAVSEGTVETIATANLWLRTADQIKIVVSELNVYSFDELFEEVRALPWEDYLPLDAESPVASKSIKSKLHSVPDYQAITKRAVVNRLKEAYHRPATTPLTEAGALFRLEVALLKGKVTLTLDTTRPGLSRRGYRIGKGGAPLKENMTVTLVMLTNWHRGRPFYDPVCGSGTVYIETISIDHNIVPGFNHSFTCETWDWADPAIFEKIRSEAEAKTDYDVELDICGLDVDGRIIEIARANVEEAGLGGSITFRQLVLKDFTTKKEYSVMVTNPPYGERLEEEENVRRLYKGMGRVSRPSTTWSKYILMNDFAFEKYYDAKVIKKWKPYSGAS